MFTRIKFRIKVIGLRILSLGPKPVMRRVGNWTLVPGLVSKESYVVSAGAGTNISFEQELSRVFGCKVDLFDPTPTGIEYMAHISNLEPKIKFHEIGLAGVSGVIPFGLPDREEEGSYRAALPGEHGSSFPCVTVSDLQKASGRPEIDVLKLDIEGFEYQVIDDLLKSRVPIRQLLVEFHTRNQISIKEGFGALVWYIIKLRLYGLRLVHVTASDFTFVRK